MENNDLRKFEINEEEEKERKKKAAIIIARRRKRRGRKLFLLLLILVMTGIMLTTTTYAWFTSNKTVSVSDVQVNVASKNGRRPIAKIPDNIIPIIENNHVLYLFALL